MNSQRFGRWRQVIIICLTRTRPCGQVQFCNLPRGLSRVEARVGGQCHDIVRRSRHGAVVSVLAGNIKECWAQDIRAFVPDYFNKPAERVFMSPMLKRFHPGLGKPEVTYWIFWRLAKPVQAQIQHICRPFHFRSAKHAKGCAGFGADVVLAALSSRGTGIADVEPIPHAKGCEHVGYLVVRMRPGIHEGNDRLKAAERTVERDDAWFKAVARNARLVGQRHCGGLSQRAGICGVKARLRIRAAAPNVAVMRPDVPHCRRGRLAFGRLDTDRSERGVSRAR